MEEQNKVNIEVVSVDDLIQDDHNFNKGTEQGQQLIERSFRECGAGRSVFIDKDNRLVGGNKAQKGFKAAGKKRVVIVDSDPDTLVAVRRKDVSLDSAEGRRMALLDNLTTQVNLAWDPSEIEAVSSEIDGFDPSDYGFDPSQLEVAGMGDETEDEAIERKRREFEEKMAAGEIGEDDPEYQEFVKKFAPEIKKTTDDCYTPTLVYDAVVEWVANEYNVSPANFVRPFYPGGDYQREKYKPTDIVVDNPPFSIMSEIIRFYQANGIRFFLFAPHLTLFSGSTDGITCLPVGVSVTYENGANICTSFLTNMEPKHIRFRSEPRLYEAVRKANEVNRAIVVKNNGKMQARYIYPEYLVQTPFLCQCSRLGFDFVATVDETYQVPELDSQKEKGKAIFGKGYLISERLLELRRKFESERYERECAFQKKVEKEKQLKEQAAREEATVWPLSERERKIIEGLK